MKLTQLKNGWKGLLYCFLLMFVRLSTNAQQNFPEMLIQANTAYETGQIDQCIELCKLCTKSNQINDQWQAYRLLSMSFLVKSNISEAREAAVKMLHLRPVYEADLLNDPKEFTQLLKQIDIIPKFSIGLSFMYGTNLTIPEVNNFYAPADYVKNYQNQRGFHLGAILGYGFNIRHGVQAQLLWKTLKYGLSYEVFGHHVQIDETFRSFEIPLLYSYTPISNNRLKYRVSAGPYISFITNAFNDLSLKNVEKSLEVQHYTSLQRRNQINYGIGAGAGLMYKMNKGHLSMDVMYFKGLSNITKDVSRYKNPTLLYDYFYLDDDLFLNNVGISLGLHRYLSFKVGK